jgi:hypothetical protein
MLARARHIVVARGCTTGFGDCAACSKLKTRPHKRRVMPAGNLGRVGDWFQKLADIEATSSEAPGLATE